MAEKRSKEDWPYVDELTPEREARQRQIIGNLPFARLIGMEIEELKTDYARLALSFRPDLTQPAGLLHGGMHATLIDTAVAQAIVTTIKPEYAMVTIHLDTKYFKPTVLGKIHAEARIVRKGAKIFHGDVQVTNDARELVAQGWCVYAIVKK